MNVFVKILLVLSFALLSACGGGSSSSNSSGNTVTVSGSVVNGPLVGATVSIYAADGTLLGQALTDEDGLYGLDGLPPSDSYRVTASGGTLDGEDYPGTLIGQCSELPCDITPLTTLFDQLADREEIPYAEAAGLLLSWLDLDTDPFIAAHQGAPVAGVDLTAVRDGLLNHPEGVAGWISAVLAAFDDASTPWVAWMGIPTVTSSTDKVWMDRNLGASQVATVHNDADAYGDLYQWGRGIDGHEQRTSSTTTTLSDSDTPGHGDFITTSSSPYNWRSPQNDNLWQGVDGTNNPCPSGFRLPTTTEWGEELTALSITNRDTAFASPLKLVSSGYRYYGGSFHSAGNEGFYWSSSVIGISARYLYFNSGSANTYDGYRAYGLSVRCLED